MSAVRSRSRKAMGEESCSLLDDMAPQPLDLIHEMQVSGPSGSQGLYPSNVSTDDYVLSGSPEDDSMGMTPGADERHLSPPVKGTVNQATRVSFTHAPQGLNTTPALQLLSLDLSPAALVHVEVDPALVGAMRSAAEKRLDPTIQNELDQISSQKTEKDTTDQRAARRRRKNKLNAQLSRNRAKQYLETCERAVTYYRDLARSLALQLQNGQSVGTNQHAMPSLQSYGSNESAHSSGSAAIVAAETQANAQRALRMATLSSNPAESGTSLAMSPTAGQLSDAPSSPSSPEDDDDQDLPMPGLPPVPPAHVMDMGSDQLSSLLSSAHFRGQEPSNKRLPPPLITPTCGTTLGSFGAGEFRTPLELQQVMSGSGAFGSTGSNGFGSGNFSSMMLESPRAGGFGGSYVDRFSSALPRFPSNGMFAFVLAFAGSVFAYSMGGGCIALPGGTCEAGDSGLSAGAASRVLHAVSGAHKVTIGSPVVDAPIRMPHGKVKAIPTVVDSMSVKILEEVDDSEELKPIVESE